MTETFPAYNLCPAYGNIHTLLGQFAGIRVETIHYLPEVVRVENDFSGVVFIDNQLDKFGHLKDVRRKLFGPTPPHRLTFWPLSYIYIG